MNNLPINLIISLFFLVGIIAVVLFVQVKLSRSKNKYFGLILPVISFLYSVLMVLGMSAFTLNTGTIPQSTMTTDDQTGEIIEESEEIIETSEQEDLGIEGFLSISYIFLISNVPTAILGGVYVSERNKITMRKQIEKMKIDDL